MTENLSRDDIADILHGATILGAGGGGDLQEGFDLIDRALKAGKTLRLVSLDEVPDEALICTPYLLGAVSDLPEGDAALVDGVHPILLAYDRLTAYFDRPIFGAMACELGGSNSAVPFFVAAMNDIAVIDADPAGRAVPEITHSSLALAGLPPGPIFTANALGETMILENLADDQRAEDMVRVLAQISGNDIAAIDHVLPARTLRRAILPGTLSKARQLGKVWREARSDPATLAQKIAHAASGAVLFEGCVTQSAARTEGSFTIGAFEVAGRGAFSGQSVRVDLKNENMVAWRDGAAIATIPEIITVLDRNTGDVVTNPNVQASQDVAILVLPAPQVFLSAKGLEVFGPGYLGLSTPFKSALAST